MRPPIAQNGGGQRMFAMQFASLSAYVSALRRQPPAGPIALIVAEDDVEVRSTIAHHAACGFAQLAVFHSPQMALPADLGGPQDDGRPGIMRISFDTAQVDALPQIVNAVIPAVPGLWLYAGFNAEYLYYPFAASRPVQAFTDFLIEERRQSVFCSVLDLYAADLAAHPDGVDRESAHFDGAGYYMVPRTDAEGAALDRQIHIQGGLRWRFEEHIPQTRRHNDRIALFQAQKGLQMGPDRTFNIAEFNTYACPWHHSPTAAIASFRTAKALCSNPGSREVITTFRWPRSVAFDWQDKQLLDRGIIAPGQWF